MDLNDSFQKELYNSFWYPMEYSLKESLSDFIRDYLIIKTKKIPNKSKVYEEFKKYFYDNYERNEESLYGLIKDMYYYSTFYEKIISKSEPNIKINNSFKDYEKLDVKVIYPFILNLYSKYDKGALLESDFIYILKLIESCIVRRVIVGLPTNSLSKIIISLIKDSNDKGLKDAIEKILASKRGVQRFPNDEDFKQNFINRDIYNLKICKFLLDKLINYDNKVILNINEFTIEHIMPQTNNLSSKWVNALGQDWEQVHRTYLHTIGNLSLTRYNGEMGTKFFIEKRDMENGYRDSACRLNSDLVSLNTWNEQEMINRANRLYDLARKIWIYPEIEFEKENYSAVLDFDDEWKNIKPKYFIFMDEKFEVKDMTDLYVSVIEELYKLDPEYFIEILKSPVLSGKSYISESSDDFRACHQLLDTDLYINTHSNNETKKKNLLSLIKEIGLSENDFTIYLSNSEDALFKYSNS